MRRTLLASTFGAAALVAAAALTPAPTQAQSAANAAPAASPGAAASSQQSAAKVIYDAQLALNKKGFVAGTPDGVMGKQTRKAIQSFQYSEGMQANGQLSDEVLDKLGVDHAGVQLGAAAAPAATTRAAPRRAVQCADFLHQARPGGSDYHGPPVAGCR